MSNEIMFSLMDIDKLDETYSFRIPECTKKQIDKLPRDLKKELNLKLLLTAAEILHKADFEPRRYLSTKNIE